MSRDQMFTKVVLASTSALSPPIFTLHLHYPRIFHAEVKTHRALSTDGQIVDVDTLDPRSLMDDRDLSRNARSSRAVPVKRMIDEIRTNPFIPWHWGKNQRGMQAGEECEELVVLQAEHILSQDVLGDYDLYGESGDVGITREEAWLEASKRAVEIAGAFAEAGYHKQLCNRLLEPFMWIDTLVTSTQWQNFLWLRDHKDAEPHFRDLAQMVKEALDGAEIQELKPGEWHLPYIIDEDREWSWDHFHPITGPGHRVRAAKEDNEILRKISAARCARISFEPFDGDASYERELQRYDMLVGSDRIHASPLEHQATPDEAIFRDGKFAPFGQQFKSEQRRGNLAPGWIQARQLVPNQAIPG